MLPKFKTFHASEKQLYTILTVCYSVSKETDVLNRSIFRETLTVSKEKSGRILFWQRLSEITVFFFD